MDEKTAKARQRKALLVAQHYASIGWAVTPGFHFLNKESGEYECSKHPSVAWSQDEVRAGRIVGATTDPDAVRDYWLGPGCDPFGADICLHAKPSRLVVVDCDRAWKNVVVHDENGNRTVERVFIDGLSVFLEFMDGDVGTELISVSKRGVHFFYLVDSEAAAKIRNRNGWLPGVDIRGGGESSGGVTIETNGVCPNRRWVRGVPRIEATEDHPEGVIVGLDPYAEIQFNASGKCIAGLPVLVDGRIEGIRPLPERLLAALLEASHATPTTAATLRQRHKIAKAVRENTPRTRPSPTEEANAVDARGSAILRPYMFSTPCGCGRCVHLGEATELLAWIPAEVDYEAWRNTIWAVSDLLASAKCGEDLVAEWSGLSIIAKRCDPDQARSIYRSDRRSLEAPHSGGKIGRGFLRSMATLCGAPNKDFAIGYMRHIANQHDATLSVECGVSTTEVLEQTLDILDAEEALAEPSSFPINSFPRFFRAMMQEGAQAQGVDVAFWGVPMLGILAGSIGATRVVHLKNGWVEPSILWSATIGASGSGKSPPLRELKRPVASHDLALFGKTRALQAAFAIAEDEWKRASRRKGKNGASSKRPALPPILAAIVDDVTLEGLLARLADNPRGLLLINDELAAWLRGFNRYRSAGGDEQTWLSMHNGDSAKVDRKGGSGAPQQILIQRAVVSVVGTIQPSVAKAHIGNPEHLGSGLAARLLLAEPPTSAAKWNSSEPSAETTANYARAVEQLLSLELADKKPIELQLSEQARILFIEFHDEFGRAGDVAAKSGEEHIAAVLSKLRGAAARMALVLALARAAEEGNAHTLTEVDAEAMAAGIALARYFDREARRLYAGWRNDSTHATPSRSLSDDDIAARILDLLKQGPKSRTELSGVFGRNMVSERLGKVLDSLKESGLVNVRTMKADGPGRPSEVWHLVEGGMHCDQHSTATN